jgi:hypothetical protein
VAWNFDCFKIEARRLEATGEWRKDSLVRSGDCGLMFHGRR